MSGLVLSSFEKNCSVVGRYMAGAWTCKVTQGEAEDRDVSFSIGTRLRRGNRAPVSGTHAAVNGELRSRRCRKSQSLSSCCGRLPSPNEEPPRRKSGPSNRTRPTVFSLEAWQATHIFHDPLCRAHDLAVVELMLCGVDLRDSNIRTIGDGGYSVGGLGGGGRHWIGNWSGQLVDDSRVSRHRG